MADTQRAKFQNSAGVEKIEIGNKEFECIGANPPYDHPHIYLDMGADDQIVCPYCSTLYQYNPKLSPGKSKPAYCAVELEDLSA